MQMLSKEGEAVIITALDRVNIKLGYCLLTDQAISLSGESEELITKSLKSEIRQLQFSAGRTAARRALAKLGIKSGAIGRDQIFKFPFFPAPSYGSISHDDAQAIAVASNDSNRIALGIDIESLSRKLSDRTIKRLFSSTEKDLLEKNIMTSIEVFSLKEAAFKTCCHAFAKRIALWDINIELSDGKFLIHTPLGELDSILHVKEAELVITVVGCQRRSLQRGSLI